MDQNAQMIRDYFEARNRNDDSDEVFLARDFVRRSSPELHGVDAYRIWKARLRLMSADEAWNILDLVSSGERVWVWLTNDSTHVGEWNGLGATGTRVRFETVNSFAVRDGKITELWRVADDWSRVKQLGGRVSWPGA